MAFTYPTQVAFINRYNTLQEALKDEVDSSQIKKIVENISREHYLDEEKKNTLGALVAFVLMGFLAKSELTHEIGERLFLNHEHSRALANEINTRIFDSVKEELEEAYNPYGDETEIAEEGGATTEQPSNERGATEIKVEPVGQIGEKIKVSAIGTEGTEPVSLPVHDVGGPVMLQKSGSFFEKPIERTENRRSPIPFNMFASSPESTEAKPAVKVKVETPHAFSWPFEKKKSQEKVIHYNELRSASSPLSQTPEGFINLSAIQDIKSSTPKEVKTEPQSIPPLTTAVAPMPIATKDTQTPAETLALAPEPEKKQWSLKSMFGKPNEEKKILIKNDVVVPENLSTNKDVPITITTSTPASAPATAPKEVSGEPKESGPALEGNVVHLK